MEFLALKVPHRSGPMGTESEIALGRQALAEPMDGREGDVEATADPATAARSIQRDLSGPFVRLEAWGSF